MKTLEILYAEDNQADVILLQAAFKLSDFLPQLNVVTNGDEALKFLDKRATEKSDFPDIFLLDLNMPRLSGFDVLKTLKGKPEFSTIFIIVFSGSTNPEDRKHSIELKADDFWAKPHDLDEAIKFTEFLKSYSGKKSKS